MKCLRRWGLPLLTGAVVLGAVLLPRQISAFQDRQILGTVHMEPVAAEELAAGEASLPEKLELLGRAIRYPGLDVYSAASRWKRRRSIPGPRRRRRSCRG